MVKTKRDIFYNKKIQKYVAQKIRGTTTDFYIGAAKICPKCGKVISDYPALSRKDNRTEICSNCGTLEALESVIEYERKIKNDKKKKRKNIYRNDKRKTKR